MTDHTPTPWRTVDQLDDDNNYLCTYIFIDDRHIGEFETPDLAQKAVHCVNTHDKLVKALEKSTCVCSVKVEINKVGELHGAEDFSCVRCDALAKIEAMKKEVE